MSLVPYCLFPLGTLGGSGVKSFHLPMQKIQETQVLSPEDSLEEEMATHSSILCLGNHMDRGAWRAMVHGVSKSRT